MLTYNQISNTDLSSNLKSCGYVVILLSSKRGKLLHKLLSNLNELRDLYYPKKSFLKKILFTLKSLFLLARIVIFHHVLFEILSFYSQALPQYTMQYNEQGKLIFEFTKFDQLEQRR